MLEEIDSIFSTGFFVTKPEPSSRFGRFYSKAFEQSAHFRSAQKNDLWKIGEVDICASLGLKALKLSIPRAVRAGHSVTLGCEYDLDEAQLYSVKWYREQEEFFRYVPKEEPPTRVFTTSGLQVDISVSNANSVTLLSVNRDISGQFQCEVSADAPLFHTQSMSALMTVVELVEAVSERFRPMWAQKLQKETLDYI
ncbi:hypothetical protein YQE_04118, partial [Dendroctonus ponderosae]